MKQLTCEMCGSTDLIKQDGFFVCQSCGTKYSVEEAKKMMIEGMVDVQGVVKVDNSAFVEKSLANARRAKQKEDWKETEKYYNMVEENDPTNIEAIFYSVFAQMITSVIKTEYATFNSSIKVLKNSMSLIVDNYKDTSEQQKFLYDIMNDIKRVKIGGLLPAMYLPSYFTNIIKSLLETYMDSLADILVKHFSEPIKKLFMENIKELSVYSKIHEKIPAFIDGYKTPKALSIEIAKNVKTNKYTSYSNIRDQIYAIGKKICPSYMILDGVLSYKMFSMAMDEVKKIHTDCRAAVRGCYIATCVYGSYDCPQVWTLRRYRDDTLGSTWYGRAFIRTYYAISPTLVKWFGKTKWFKKMWKGKLDRMVKKLQDNGVENTPYEDKEW